MYRFNYLFYFLFILISCSSSTDIPEGEEDNLPTTFVPQNVLFIGNSHTYFNTGVDFHLQEYASRGDLPFTPFITKIAFGGYTLEQHLENELTLEILKERAWDVVILQENTFRAANEMEAALIAIPAFKAKLTNPNAKVYLFMTWAYEDEPAMLSNIKQTYERGASLINGIIVPVGNAFDIANEDSSTSINLYNADGVHPSLEGTFLAASMFYNAIYNKNPELNTYTSGLNDDTATYLKQLAKSSYESYPQ